jgi:hypothetical protein
LNLKNLIFVDCEARGTSPVNGTMTEFAAGHYGSGILFHGRIFEGTPDPENPAVPLVGKRVKDDLTVAMEFTAWIQAVCDGRPVMVSDNPAYDFMWIAGLLDVAGLKNPLGHSARRISDFWAGLNQEWGNTQSWKKMRKTKHDHNPVHDVMGNMEAFARIITMMREGAFLETQVLPVPAHSPSHPPRGLASPTVMALTARPDFPLRESPDLCHHTTSPLVGKRVERLGQVMLTPSGALAEQRLHVFSFLFSRSSLLLRDLPGSQVHVEGIMLRAVDAVEPPHPEVIPVRHVLPAAGEVILRDDLFHAGIQGNAISPVHFRLLQQGCLDFPDQFAEQDGGTSLVAVHDLMIAGPCARRSGTGSYGSLSPAG